MGNAALATGVAILAVTGLSQTKGWPPDFAAVALLGVAGATFCSTVARSRKFRSRALVGLTLCLVPVAMLAYFLAVSDG